MNTLTQGIFGITPIELLQDKRLSANDYRVFIALSSYQGHNDKSYPSQKAISERCGVPASKISTHVKRLESFGWVKITRLGWGKSNRYVCMNPSNVEIITRKKQPENLKKLKKKSSEIDENYTLHQTSVNTPNQCNTSTPNQCNTDYTKPVESYIEKNTEKNNVKEHLPEQAPTSFQELNKYFYDFHKEHTGNYPALNGRHGKAVKELLKLTTIDEIKKKSIMLLERRKTGNTFWQTKGLTAIEVLANFNSLSGTAKHPEQIKLEDALGL